VDPYPYHMSIRYNKDLRSSFSGGLLSIQSAWHRYRGVVGIFFFSQFLFVLGVGIGWKMLPAAYASVSADDQEFGLLVSSHFRWDALHYITLARDGYRSPLDQGIFKLPAFFPLFPLGVKLSTVVLGVRSLFGFAWTAITLDLLFCLGAFLIIYNLGVKAGLDSSTALRSILFLAICPFALFLVVPYTEALFLFLSSGFFWFVFKQKWISAGITAGLLSATRLNGILFSILLVLEFCHSAKENGFTLKNWLRFIPAFVFSILGLVFYMVYLQATYSDPFAFLHAQSNWNRDVQIPFVTLWRGLAYAFDPGRTEFLDQYLINTLHTIFIVFFITVMLASRHRWNWLYQVYGWLLLTISLISPLQGSATMQSTARYMMVFFPIHFTLADWGRTAWVRTTIYSVFLLLYLFLSAFYGRGFFVG
jgi:Gpi18-like mannosyltransferase